MKKLLALSLASSLALVGSINAQIVYTWNVGAGNWNVNTNWSPSGVPTSGDTAIINSGIANVNLTTPSLTGLTVNQSAGDASRASSWTLTTTIYNLSGGNLSITGASNLALNTNAGLNVSGSGAATVGGTLSVGGNSTLGISSGSLTVGAATLQNTGFTATISGGSFNVTGSLGILQGGAFNMSNGTVTAGSTSLASTSPGTVVSVSGGTFNGGALTLNRATFATPSEFNISGNSALSFSSIAFGATGSFAPAFDFSNLWTGSLSLTGATTLTDYWNALTSTGTFANVQLNNTPINFSTFSSTFAINGSNALVIPEPTTWALLAGSLTALVVFRRRRQLL